MVSSARRAIAGILLIVAFIIHAQAQQPAATKVPGGSISGTVTIKGKAAAGIVVIAIGANSWEVERYRAITDQLGNYAITKLSAGSYEVEPAVRSLITETTQPPKSVLLSDGENVEKVDFALLRGGAITGRVTDTDGQPLIEEPVQLLAVNNESGNYEPGQTDDRGVYRIFGVRPGKYKVSAGRYEEEGLSGGPRTLYKKTFHPSVTDPEKAILIEVKEGSESSNVDIVMSRPATLFKVSGKVVEGETGKPVPNIHFRIALERDHGSLSTGGGPGTVTNAAGDFKLDNMSPGKYSIFIFPGSNARADALSFEVIDHDLKDLLIKTTKGASVSGVVVLEGSEDKAFRPKYGQLMVYASSDEPTAVMNVNPQLVNQDGTFKIDGLRNGKVRLDLLAVSRPGAPRYGIARVELNGVPLPDGIELNDAEDVAGLRLVIREHNGKIRGVVKLEKGEPKFTFVSLSLLRLEDDPLKNVAQALSSEQVDSRGHFLLEGIAPGTYVLHAQALLDGGQKQLSAKKQVIVTNNTVSDVTLTLESTPDPDQ